MAKLSFSAKKAGLLPAHFTADIHRQKHKVNHDKRDEHSVKVTRHRPLRSLTCRNQAALNIPLELQINGFSHVHLAVLGVPFKHYGETQREFVLSS